MAEWNDDIEYRMVVCVWGQEYATRFLNCVLPSWMSPGNLPALAKLTPKFIFYTDDASITLFEADKNIATLKKFGSILYEDIEQFRKINPQLRYDHMWLMTTCENHALMQGQSKVGKIGFFFMHSDTFFADGSFASVMKLIKQGKRAILGTSLRVSDGALREELALFSKTNADGAVSTVIPSRKLVELALKHLHPLELARTLGEAISTCDLSRVYWRLPGGDLYGPSMEMHPFFCRPKRFSLIGDYLGNAGDNFIDYVFGSTLGLEEDAYAYLLDSDDFFNISIEDPSKFAERIQNHSLTVEDMSERLLDGWPGPFQLQNLQKLRISFHAEDLPDTTALETKIEHFLLSACFLTLTKIAYSRIDIGLKPLSLDTWSSTIPNSRLIRLVLKLRKILFPLHMLKRDLQILTRGFLHRLEHSRD